MKKTLLAVALRSALGVVSLGVVPVVGAQAAAVNPGDTLSLDAGVPATDAYGLTTNVTGGSWFGVDYNGDSKIIDAEKNALEQGTTGIIIGQTTSQGASHPGRPAAGDTNEVTAPWLFFGNTGSDYLTTGVTGDTTSGLDFSGWTVIWNGIAAMPMGAGAWQTTNCSVISPGCTSFSDGVGNFIWDGTDGGAYTLDYTATVPYGNPSGLGGVQYYLHLEGTVTRGIIDPPPPPDVPLPAAAWLLGSGLLGLVGVARRRKANT